MPTKSPPTIVWPKNVSNQLLQLAATIFTFPSRNNLHERDSIIRRCRRLGSLPDNLTVLTVMDVYGPPSDHPIGPALDWRLQMHKKAPQSSLQFTIVFEGWDKKNSSYRQPLLHRSASSSTVKPYPHSVPVPRQVSAAPGRHPTYRFCLQGVKWRIHIWSHR